ncbi:MAG: glycosyltransferase [Deltaproteobacteria bacterium]|nr:glycosyltransferase [Deltaproteobacteria bacterium]MBW2417460.1 glycosyltransferase [Deltaproteobacteria bacterium]
MNLASLALQGLLLIPVVVGAAYALIRLGAVAWFALRRPWREPGDGSGSHSVADSAQNVSSEGPSSPNSYAPPVTLLKPVYGLEKNLEECLRSACLQDYPEYQVLISLQRPDDPALPLLRKLETEFGSERVTITIAKGEPRANGKVFNVSNAMPEARHELLVLSDSDVRLRPNFLRVIVAPLRDSAIGYACTIYRGRNAHSWHERVELLSLHDLMANVIFAHSTGASDFCLGSSMAFRRSSLDAIGGFEPLENYLVEDFEMGRRIQELGLGIALVAYSVDTMIDLDSVRDWWRHQLYLELNNRMARPIGFFATIVIQPLPFALLLCLYRLFDPLSLGILVGSILLRLVTTGLSMPLMGEREGLRNLLFMPLRDLAASASWLLALRMSTVTWRGVEFRLGRDGRMVPLVRDRSG